MVKKYRDAGEYGQFSEIYKALPPHVFKIAASAYRSMTELSASVTPNQSILVSGMCNIWLT
jgi:myosin heavy subunit